MAVLGTGQGVAPIALRQLAETLPPHVTAQIMAASEKALSTVQDLARSACVEPPNLWRRLAQRVSQNQPPQRQSLDNRTNTLYAQNMLAFARRLTTCLRAGRALTASPAHPFTLRPGAESFFVFMCAPVPISRSHLVIHQQIQPFLRPSGSKEDPLMVT